MLRRPFAALVDRPAADWNDDEREARAKSAAYWRGLDANLTVGEPPIRGADLPPDVDAKRIVDDLSEEGFFRTPAVVDARAVGAMLAAVDAVVREGWPPVFAYVYDCLWDAIGTGALDELMAAVLGDGCRLSSGMWLNYVRPVDGAAGWAPHIDIPGPPPPRDASGPERLTVWVPITDATLESSCIHVLPRSWAERADVDLTAGARLSVHEAMTLLHGARALPAPAGAVLGWAPNVLHWGSPVTRDANGPRISLSLELLHEDTKKRAGETLIERGARPSLDERLFLIGLGLRLYAADPAREPYAHGFVSVGQRFA